LIILLSLVVGVRETAVFVALEAVLVVCEARSRQQVAVAVLKRRFRFRLVQTMRCKLEMAVHKVHRQMAGTACSVQLLHLAGVRLGRATVNPVQTAAAGAVRGTTQPVKPLVKEQHVKGMVAEIHQEQVSLTGRAAVAAVQEVAVLLERAAEQESQYQLLVPMLLIQREAMQTLGQVHTLTQTEQPTLGTAQAAALLAVVV